MFSKSLAFAILFLPPLVLATIADEEFVFNGFNDSSGWDLQGSAVMLKNGILSLGNTNAGIVQPKSHAFYPSPFQMRNLTDSSIFSFSATFAFSILHSNCDESPNSLYRYSSTGDGITFVIAPNTSFTNVTSYGSFGLLDPNNNGKLSNHLVSIELDIRYNREFGDIDDNHVGININSLNSSVSSPAGYYTDDTFSDLHPLRLSSGKEMQVWIDYDQRLMQLNVSLAPIPEPKPKHSLLSHTIEPKHSLLSHTIDLSQVLLDYMYVGFSSSSWDSYSGFILGCSFKMNGEPASLDYSKLPRVNTTQPAQPVTSRGQPFLFPPASQSFKVVSRIAFPTLVFLGSAGTLILLVPIILVVRRCYRYREIREDWELEFGPHRFSYKDLFHATDGFKDKQLLGTGGFGKVYKGLLQLSKQEVAVKVMSHDSKQGMKEFVAEVVSMGRLRHRSLVQLLGYCRRKGELLLVYEYMPNGSLDKHLYNLDPEKPSLGWALRFEIIKGVASGLFYLHEEWEQVVIHRDVKASNVLLDGEMNGRLGDFGLARLHDHGVEAHTTCVAGTLGYISSELARLGKATKATDVFAFGAFILEVACGRRPIGPGEFPWGTSSPSRFCAQVLAA